MKKSIQLFTILSFVAITVNLLFAQTQVGEDINGETAEDLSGASISLSADGNRVAIGARFNDGNGNKAGQVRIYEWNSVEWIQLGDDIDGEAEGDESGWSVSLSSDGNRVAIGARFNDGNGSNAGHVRIFEWGGGIWAQVGEDINGEAAADFSGFSVSLSSDGSRVAIGAPFSDGNGSASGHVRVFEWMGANWAQMGSDIVGEADSDQSGSVSLSSDGNRVAIGAPWNSGNGSNAGHVRVYGWSGGSWSQIGEDIDGETAGDYSGWSVSLSSNGSMVAIGAIGNDGNGNKAGQVRVYEWDGGNWTQAGADIDGETAEDESGLSVSLSADGNRVAIGAADNEGNLGLQSKVGHVRTYKWDGGNWTQVGADIDGEAAGDFSGESVSLSADGSRVAIGAGGNDGNGENAGHVRIYEFSVVSTINPSTIKQIEIYPNPTTGKIEIVGSDYGTIKIMDSFGRILMKREKPELGIDISDFANGVYFIYISSDNNWIVKKIIKQ